MTTQKNKKLNIDIKSQLAKLIATENVQVEHNAVKTASFDTLNRILTLPIFKVQSGDVYDMLIAHECAHALYTPQSGWQEIQNDDELRSYCNVLEDTRIDKLIQKKYPGVVKNYLNGWDILNKQNFFGIKNIDVNTDLMLIDKINLRSKSLDRLKFKLSKEEDKWLDVVDSIKSWKDVVKVAKQMLDWQKKQLEQLKKLPNFDELNISKNYKLSNSSGKDSENNEDLEKISSSTSDDEKKDEKNTKGTKIIKSPVGGGQGTLKSITDVSYESKKESLVDTSKKYSYFNLPEVNLKNCFVSNKSFLNNFRNYINTEKLKSRRSELYHNWLKNEYKSFKKENSKTVMYLVKEFQLKKSATAYKRASTDKTGVIDSLKLKNYKFSDDIFKRLTVLPNEKNHGMMMLLDWSGSMSPVIKKTVDQLLNLIWFCQKINIPYEVYFFSSEREVKDEYDKQGNKVSTSFKYKHNDMALDNFNLVNVASHKMKKIELDESLMYLYSMGLYYDNRYTGYNDYGSSEKHYNFGMPSQYQLGSTPFIEALVVMNKLIPAFKQKYKIEKMTFITLTDGASNNIQGKYVNKASGLEIDCRDSFNNPVIRINKKCHKLDDNNIYNWTSHKITGTLLDSLRKNHNVNTLGFFILKKIKGWEGEMYFPSAAKDTEKRKQQFVKDKCATATMPGYNEFYIINGKSMAVENTDLSDITGNLKTGKIKQIFAKSMKGRIVSRVILNKFIDKVA
jgi:hypothetical protein